jgi:hypothetical protein
MISNAFDLDRLVDRDNDRFLERLARGAQFPELRAGWWRINVRAFVRLRTAIGVGPANGVSEACRIPDEQARSKLKKIVRSNCSACGT